MDGSGGRAADRRPNGKTLLVVDDDEATRQFFILFLERMGYAVAPARNGRAAVDYLRDHPPPDLVLLNRTMSVTDRDEYGRAQRNDPALAAVPVIVLAAVGEAGIPTDLFGAVGYIPQPVDADVLLAAIRRFTAPSKPQILVVEEEAAILKLLDVVLRRYGFGVWSAASGPEAVDLYSRHHESIALVLLEVEMSDLDGPATLAALQRIDPEIRCCFMSGHTGKYAAEELLALGAAHVLQKPFVSLSIVTRLLWDLSGVDT